MAVLRQLYEEELSLGGGFMLDDQELLEALAHQMVGGVFKIVPLPTVPHSPTAEGFTKVVTIEEVEKERTKIISDGLTWIAFRLKYDDGRPIPYEPYEIFKPDGGLLQKGKLNEEGYVRVDQILAGDYSIVFPGRGGAPADTENTDWIEVKLVDEDDKLMPREVYEILDSEGKVYRRGQLDAEGFVREEGVEKGEYTIVFPRLGEVWAAADAGTDWIGIRLKYEDGTPAADEPYEVRRVNGTALRRGRLDAKGEAKEERIATGTYEVLFPKAAGSVSAAAGKGQTAAGDAGPFSSDYDLFDYAFEQEGDKVHLSFSIRGKQPSSLKLRLFECSSEISPNQRQQSIAAKAAKLGTAAGYLKSGCYHEVKSGESGDGLAQRYGHKDKSAIEAHYLNDGVDSSALEEGDELFIPQVQSEEPIPLGDLLEVQPVKETVQEGKRYQASWVIGAGGHSPLNPETWLSELDFDLVSSDDTTPLSESDDKPLYLPQFVVLTGDLSAIGVSPTPLQIVKKTKLEGQSESKQQQVIFPDGKTREVNVGEGEETFAEQEEPLWLFGAVSVDADGAQSGGS